MTKITLAAITFMTAAAPALAHGDHGTGLETIVHFALSADHLLGAVVGAGLTLAVIGGLKWLRRAR